MLVKALACCGAVWCVETLSGSDIVSGGGAGLDGGDVSGANDLGGGGGSVARTGCGGLGPVADDVAVASTEAAFPRATATEIRWYSHAVSRLSPVRAVSLRPSSFTSSAAAGPTTPAVSTAKGTKCTFRRERRTGRACALLRLERRCPDPRPTGSRRSLRRCRSRWHPTPNSSLCCMGTASVHPDVGRRLYLAQLVPGRSRALRRRVPAAARHLGLSDERGGRRSLRRRARDGPAGRRGTGRAGRDAARTPPLQGAGPPPPGHVKHVLRPYCSFNRTHWASCKLFCYQTYGSPETRCS